MSKIFSYVEIKTNIGIIEYTYMPGIPDWDDIEKCILYKKLIETYKDIEYIDVNLESYCYGKSKGVDTTSIKDLEYISSWKNFTQREDVDWLQNYKFTIYPQEK